MFIAGNFSLRTSPFSFMSNILQFRSFHERHFSPEQVQYWQQHILNRQQQGQQQQQQHDTWQWQKYNESYAPYHDNDQNVADQETYVQEEDTEINMEREQETTLSQQQQQQQQQQTSLSQEAIEIFKFSEAYRKERKFFVRMKKKKETLYLSSYHYY